MSPSAAAWPNATMISRCCSGVAGKRGRRASTALRARAACWRAAADELPSAPATSSNEYPNTSWSTNAVRSDADSDSSTTSRARLTSSRRRATSSGPGSADTIGSGSHGPT